VAAGVRRIEALTGEGAYRAVLEQQDRLRQVADALRSQPDQAARRAEQLMQEKTKLETRLAEALKGGGAVADQGQTLEIRGVSVTVTDTALESRDEVAAVADSFRQGRAKAVLVLFNPEGRGAVHVAVTEDLVQSGRKAGELVGKIAALGGGKGGGRPQFASAGLGDVSRMAEIRSGLSRVVDDWLNGGG
jgi:alanyl-tRNA synthetase